MYSRSEHRTPHLAEVSRTCTHLLCSPTHQHDQHMVQLCGNAADLTVFVFYHSQLQRTDCSNYIPEHVELNQSDAKEQAEQTAFSIHNTVNTARELPCKWLCAVKLTKNKNLTGSARRAASSTSQTRRRTSADERRPDVVERKSEGEERAQQARQHQEDMTRRRGAQLEAHARQPVLKAAAWKDQCRSSNSRSIGVASSAATE